MNHDFTPLNYREPFNSSYTALPAGNNASSSTSATPGPSPQSIVAKVGQIGKEYFPGQANAQMPYVNLSGRLSPVQTTNKIQKQVKTRASTQKTQQVTSQSVLPKKKRQHYSFPAPSKSEIEALFHLSLDEAAETLKISMRNLRQFCRENGIKRWPSRFSLSRQFKTFKTEEQGLKRGLILPASAAPSSSASQRNQIYDNRIPMANSSTSYFNSHAEEAPHSFRPIERDNSHREERLHSVPNFPIQPPRLPSIFQLNLTPVSQSNDKPLTGDAILRMAKQALNHSNSSLNG